MKAYVISEVAILDETLGEEYKEIAAASILQYGGKYLVRGAPANVVEGEATTRQIVIVQFPTMDKLKEWYASPEYAKALKIRRLALDRRLTFVEGVPRNS